MTSPPRQQDELIKALAAEAARIEEDTLHSSKGHFNAGALWSKVHIGLGLPAAILAAWAGMEAFSDNPQLTSLLAILAAGLGAVSTFLNPSDKATAHKNAGRELNALKNKARHFREIDLLLADPSEAAKTLKTLSIHRDEFNSVSPDIPRWAYEMAKKDIDSGRATYAVDKDAK